MPVCARVLVVAFAVDVAELGNQAGGGILTIYVTEVPDETIAVLPYSHTHRGFVLSARPYGGFRLGPPAFVLIMHHC